MWKPKRAERAKDNPVLRQGKVFKKLANMVCVSHTVYKQLMTEDGLTTKKQGESTMTKT